MTEPTRIKTQYRAVIPLHLTADSAIEFRPARDDREDAAAEVKFVNWRLEQAGLPQTARLESREVFASEWRTEPDNQGG